MKEESKKPPVWFWVLYTLTCWTPLIIVWIILFEIGNNSEDEIW